MVTHGTRKELDNPSSSSLTKVGKFSVREKTKKKMVEITFKVKSEVTGKYDLMDVVLPYYCTGASRDVFIVV